MKYFALFCFLAVVVCSMAYRVEDQMYEASENAPRQERHAHHHHHHGHHHHDHHDHVDFGAHTGEHGSFGWYADFPVHGHH